MLLLLQNWVGTVFLLNEQEKYSDDVTSITGSILAIILYILLIQTISILIIT